MSASGFSASLARLLRVPPEPDPPAGSPGSLQVFRAANGYVRYRMVGWLIAHVFSFLLLVPGPLILALALTFGEADELGAIGLAFIWLLALGFVGFWLFLVIVGWLTIRVDRDMRWYMVTDRSLRIREGVWIVREMTMTFANIQNISVTQGPLQRSFGIADLVVQTAGGGGAAQQGQAHASLHVGHFRGIADAMAVRDFVLDRMKRAAGAGLGDSVEPGPSPLAGADDPLIAGLTAVKQESGLLRETVCGRAAT
ncbi:MAG: PH domain-containing protein [Myxococcales bacterium]|nr:PH domain-containing protein [Myxococcales bacterium]